jgi:hypothetical protein
MAFKKGESGNPAGRPRGSVNKSLRLLRDAAEAILPDLIDRAKDGDLEAQKLILDRGIPRLRAVSMPEALALPDGTLTDQAKALVALIAAGDLSTTIAAEIAGIITASARVEEVDQLRDELKALRALLEGRRERH